MRGPDLVAAMQHEAARLARQAAHLKGAGATASYMAARDAGVALLDAAAEYRIYTDTLARARLSKGD